MDKGVKDAITETKPEKHWQPAMTETEYSDELLFAARMLIGGDIDKNQFEKLCKNAWMSLNGAVPEGRELWVGIVDDRLAVGHKDRIVGDAPLFNKVTEAVPKRS